VTAVAQGWWYRGHPAALQNEGSWGMLAQTILAQPLPEELKIFRAADIND